MVELLATNPAKLFGLYPRKVELAPGSDADIVVFDPERKPRSSAATQQSQSDYNPYEGWVIRGAVDTVLLRGDVIVEGGRFIGRAGRAGSCSAASRCRWDGETVAWSGDVGDHAVRCGRGSTAY